jgi:molybdenum cofactor biosynthesis protein MoaC
VSNNGVDFTHLKEDGKVAMVDVTAKIPTKRSATASCLLTMSPATLQALRDKALPKGDALTLAQVAGIQGAKWTSHLIPLCHSLEARNIEVKLALEETGVRIRASVETIAPTGPEMEAMVGATITGLALYDMCKAVDKNMVLESVRLESKSGGKSDLRVGALEGRTAVLLTLSDRASAGVYEDKSGPIAAKMIQEAGFSIEAREIIPDEKALVTEKLKVICDNLSPDLILTLGSTGLSPRDIAPEAAQAVIERLVPGFPETFRAQYFPHHPTSSFLSRGVAGLRGKTFIVNLPGRPSAVAEGLALLIPALKHVFQMVDAEGHEK